jgi:transcriptional regulator with XRE-family HTH domain
MTHALHTTALDAHRARIASRCRELREARRWTQRDLAARLGLSQGRLSRIENEQASFTAEEFVLLLQILNADYATFTDATDASKSLQNALARYGAAHLREHPDVGVREGHGDAMGAVRAVLLRPDSERFIAALAPVLVFSIHAIPLPALQHDLATAGVPNRLGWLAENTLAALGELTQPRHPHQELQFQRAAFVLRAFLADLQPSDATLLDPFDQGIRSEASLQAMWDAASDLSKRWRIASALTVDDFRTALEDALEHHR